jgi:hypothetical protein
MRKIVTVDIKGVPSQSAELCQPFEVMAVDHMYLGYLPQITFKDEIPSVARLTVLMSDGPVSHWELKTLTADHDVPDDFRHIGHINFSDGRAYLFIGLIALDQPIKLMSAKEYWEGIKKQ